MGKRKIGWVLVVLCVTALVLGYFYPECLAVRAHAPDDPNSLPTTGPYALLAGKKSKALALFSYHWDRIPARKAIGILAEDSGMRIEMPARFDRPVTLHARWVRPLAALVAISRQLPRCYCKTTGDRCVKIVPGVPPPRPFPRDVLPIPPEHLQVDQRLCDLVKAAYLRQIKVFAVKEQNFMFPDGPRLLVRDLKEFIQALDQPPPASPTPLRPSEGP